MKYFSVLCVIAVIFVFGLMHHSGVGYWFTASLLLLSIIYLFKAPEG